MYSKYILIAPFTVAFFCLGCNEKPTKLLSQATEVESHNTEALDTRVLNREFNNYWYTGKAEITSYKLKQARYGELREGTAVTIFVTEDFLPKVQVKANNQSKTTTPVLKLNSTKNFLTGVYPYSIMTSTFSPVNKKGHALKVSNSIQEWCGHVYAQLNNKEQFEITAHSYFEGEADQSTKLPKNWLENEFWNLLRINPNELPLGEVNVIPSFDYLKLTHNKLKAYPAVLDLENEESMYAYTIKYPSLDRSLTIYFENKFPFSIEKWEETYFSGYGEERKSMTTTATKIKQIKTAYWAQNSNKDAVLREELGLN